MCQVKDSNLRRLMPADLQSAPFVHLGNLAWRDERFTNLFDTARFAEPREGIGPSTSFLPRKRSATELSGRSHFATQ